MKLIMKTPSCQAFIVQFGTASQTLDADSRRELVNEVINIKLEL
jgi:hypothetical protein